METPQATLQHGLELHRQGRYAEAEAIYRGILATGPESPLALYCFGRLALDVQNFAIAADYLSKAVAADPSQSQYHADLARALHSLGRLDQAASSYTRALAAEPGRADWHVALGNALLQAGQVDQAIASYRTAIDRDPKLPEPHSCLGAAFEQQGRLDEAADCYRRAIEVRPDHAFAHFNLGTLLIGQGHLSEALSRLEKAVELAPDFAPAHHNLGVVFNRLGEPAQAQACLERSLELDPRQATCQYNLGESLELQGRVEAALGAYSEAYRLDPKLALARVARGAALLKLGRWAEGWAEYEYRVGMPKFDTLSPTAPRWDGSPLGDRTLLVHGEQGLGDHLQFIRYVPLAQARAGKVVVATRPELIPLLTQSGYKNLASKNEPPGALDVHIPMMSLPSVFASEPSNVPAEVPYLTADPALIASWAKRLAKHPGFKVGIHWQGNPAYQYDRERSIPLAEFAPLASVAGATLISLQKKDGLDQLTALADRFQVIDLGPELDEKAGLFMDTAAVIASLDLVITCDSAIAHLAGGLGSRVWVALPFAGEWRWLLDRDDSPWYPTMRLFRQTTPGDWPGVFERMAAALKDLVASHSSS